MRVPPLVDGGLLPRPVEVGQREPLWVRRSGVNETFGLT